MSELEKSLTDIGWLNQKLNSSKHPRKETELNSENKLDDLERKSETLSNLPLPQKPVLSYANLIILAIRSASDHMMTLREIYNWVTDTYPYFRYIGNGWKNSIRHNLSLNKCFLKVSRPKDDKGKGCYWTFDRSYLDEDGYLKSKSRTRTMNQDRGSPYNQNHSPNPAFNETPLFLKTSCKLQPSSEEETSSLEPNSLDQFLLPFPNNQKSVLDQPDLLNLEIEPHIKDHGQFYCIRYHPAISETNPSCSNNSEVDKNSQISNDCSITENKPINDSMQGSTNLSNSFKKLFTTVFENIENEMFSRDSIRNYESLKNSIKLAGFTNWSEINLSGFRDLAEIIKDADTNKWSLNHDQVLDLAASLTKFYSSIPDIETQSNIINPLKDPFFSKDSTYHNDNFDVNSLLSYTEQTMPYPGHDCAQIIDGNDEIEDDFNWESLLLI